MNEVLQIDQPETISEKEKRERRNEILFCTAVENAFDKFLEKEMDQLHKPKRLRTHPEIEFITKLKAARELYGKNY